MKYSDFGLVNTRAMFRDAMTNHYAVPAFNFFNMETLNAILSAARETHSPVILAVSESAMKYMGPKMLMGMIRGADLRPENGVALHLDHGGSIDACVRAIDMGFSSVMIDANKLPFAENIDASRTVTEYAHKFDVSVEAELGTIAGIEDENTFSAESTYTRPSDVVEFVRATNIDSLAIAIGTSHGAHKRKSETEELRFDILAKIAELLPEFPLVLHGASTVPQKLIETINANGGKISNACGIPAEQLRRANAMNVCKINIDSDCRLAFTAGVRESLFDAPNNFNPREYLTHGMDAVRQTCIYEIKNIMASANRI